MLVLFMIFEIEKDACVFVTYQGQVKLCLCDHVVCRSCLTKAEKHELTVECPLSSLCRMRYPLDVLKSSKTKAS